MEGTDRALRIALQIVEERRFETRLDSLKNGEVKFQKFLHRIEYPPGASRGRIGCEFLHFTVGGDVDVEVGSEAFQDAGELQR